MKGTKIFATGVAALTVCVAGTIPAAAADDGFTRMTVLRDGTVSGYTDCTASNKFVAIRVRYVDGWPLRIATYSQEIGQRTYEFPAGAGVIEVDRTQATWHHSASWSATVVGGPDGAFVGWEGVCV